VGAGGSKGIGFLDPAAYDQTVTILMGGGSDPIITKKPEGGWTHSVYDAALKDMK
jgi:NitT/TauT family transport system substrate-binding protein